MALGDNIKRLREERQLTQQMLADKLYVSRQTVCRWENGTRCPDLIMAKRIAMEFDVSLDELISDEDLKKFAKKEFMNIKDTRADTIMEYLCRIMLIGTLIYLIVCWSTIPDQIPTHYNAAGEIDDWGGKGMIWFTVIISWALYLGISFVERYPDMWNTGVEITRKNSEKVYRLLKYLIRTSKLIMTAVFSTLIIFPAMEKPLPVWFTPVYLILLTGNAVFWLIRIFLARK